MTTKDIAYRALATAVQSFTAVLIAGGTGLIDAALWQQAATAALGGVIAFAHRLASRYLERPVIDPA